jgi:hypothetical protein
MEKKNWDEPELMTILMKETEHGQQGSKLDDNYPRGTEATDIFS